MQEFVESGPLDQTDSGATSSNDENDIDEETMSVFSPSVLFSLFS